MNVSRSVSKGRKRKKKETIWSSVAAAICRWKWGPTNDQKYTSFAALPPGLGSRGQPPQNPVL